MKNLLLTSLITFSISAAVSQQIFCGENHSLLVCESGDLYSFGDNGSGQLGTGDYLYQTVPFLVQDLPPIVHAAGGGLHSLAVTDNGDVYAWGSGSDGQIGDGTVGVFYNTPQLLTGISDVIQVSAGRYFSAALKSDGTVWTWGRNDSGNLGLGNYDAATVPTQVPSLTNITRIECGNWNLFAINESGEVYAMGDNNFGALGLGSNFPPTYNTPQLMSLDNVAKIEAGYWHVVAMKTDNSIWVWGDDSSGQLGQGQSAFATSPIPVLFEETIVDISAGNSFSQALDVNGNIHSWGSNYYGQLCNGTNNNFSNVIASPTDLTNIVTVASGDFHGLYINSSGELKGCGKNDGGQLGDGTTSNSTSAVNGFNSCETPENIENVSLSMITAYPNPVIDEITLSIDPRFQDYEIDLFDSMGRLILVDIAKLGIGLVSINTSPLPNGEYILNIRSEAEIQYCRFSKLK